MANQYTYEYETGEYSCESFDFEPSWKAKQNAIIDIAYNEFFKGKDDDKRIEESKKALVKNFIDELDLWDAVEEGMDYNDMIKDYFKDQAFEEWEG